MANILYTNVLLSPPHDVNSLPPSQYDQRNIIGTRFLELGWSEPYNTGVDPPVPIIDTTQRDPLRIRVSTQSISELFHHDPSFTFRVLTVGLDTYYVKRRNVPNQLEPIAIRCEALQRNAGGRYMLLIPNDFAQPGGATNSTTFSFVGHLSPTLEFELGIVNPAPSDLALYPFNTPRTESAPFFPSQDIYSVLIRLYFKATFEPNYIPFNPPLRGIGAGGVCGAPDKRPKGYGGAGVHIEQGTAGGSASAMGILTGVHTSAVGASALAGAGVSEISAAASTTAPPSGAEDEIFISSFPPPPRPRVALELDGGPTTARLRPLGGGGGGMMQQVQRALSILETGASEPGEGAPSGEGEAPPPPRPSGRFIFRMSKFIGDTMDETLAADPSLNLIEARRIVYEKVKDRIPPKHGYNEIKEKIDAAFKERKISSSTLEAAGAAPSGAGAGAAAGVDEASLYRTFSRVGRPTNIERGGEGVHRRTRTEIGVYKQRIEPLVESVSEEVSKELGAGLGLASQHLPERLRMAKEVYRRIKERSMLTGPSNLKHRRDVALVVKERFSLPSNAKLD